MQVQEIGTVGTLVEPGLQHHPDRLLVERPDRRVGEERRRHTFDLEPLPAANAIALGNNDRLDAQRRQPLGELDHMPADAFARRQMVVGDERDAHPRHPAAMLSGSPASGRCQ